MEYILLIISAALVNNFVLSRFLGICPFIGVSKRTDTAIGMSMAVVFVITLASLVTWLLNHYILMTLGLEYLQTIVFILVIAFLVQLVEMIIQKVSMPLYQALGIYLPLITTNCAVLGVALLNINLKYDFLEAVIFGAGSAVGFGLALIIFAGMREEMELSNIPKVFQGTPIALVTAGILSLAFMGFSGLVK
ncbi:MAG TPA: electron transport complex subunit RsxA [Deltaproteobacteria bacterium]|jgi:electron transport complex protein RnfA|nr:electron transport complex subunit RsxA [Deltaproteobacteria bacterium]HOI07103.1 electron transport complex subunit RsxA [Deltaproteobacteria bacterium]